MATRARDQKKYSTPSPGAILRRQAEQAARAAEESATGVDGDARGAVLSGNPFQLGAHAEALMERGVMLAPLLVQWTYQVSAPHEFTKWLKTKDIILSGARFSLTAETSGIHYFGTYFVEGAQQTPLSCQTLWGFSSEAAMSELFNLCRGQIERVSIVENDLRDFVLGLKSHIRSARPQSFQQSVLVSAARGW